MAKAKGSPVTWEEPPAKRHSYDWDAIAEELRKRPGQWAKVFDRDRTSLATAIRINGIKALRPADGFEVRTTNNYRVEGEVRTCTLYLRYNPQKGG